MKVPKDRTASSPLCLYLAYRGPHHLMRSENTSRNIRLGYSHAETACKRHHWSFTRCSCVEAPGANYSLTA